MCNDALLSISVGSGSPRVVPESGSDALFAAYVGETVTLSFADPLFREDGTTVTDAIDDVDAKVTAADSAITTQFAILNAFTGASNINTVVTAIATASAAIATANSNLKTSRDALVAVEANITTGPVVTVVREPSGSALTFTAGVATLTDPGLHTFTVQNGSAPARTVRVVAFPAEALTAYNIKEPNRQVYVQTTVSDPNPRPEAMVREMLQRWTLEYGRAGGSLTALDSLSANAPLPASVDWRNYSPTGH